MIRKFILAAVFTALGFASAYAQSVYAPYGGYDIQNSGGMWHVLNADTTGNPLFGNQIGDAFIGGVVNPSGASPTKGAGILVKQNGHQTTVGGTAPVASACGTTPTQPASPSNDNRFTLTSGTGTPTACTITFNVAWTSTPVCVANLGLIAAGAFAITALSTTAMTITWTNATNSVPIFVICEG